MLFNEKIKKKLILFGVMASLAVILVITSGKVSADGEFYMHGYGWSSTVGWMSMGGSNYGVTFESVPYRRDIYTLSGYSWMNPRDNSVSSNNIGWVNWAPVHRSVSDQAEIDFNTGKFHGFIRACSVFQRGCSGVMRAEKERGGWDGWISLEGTTVRDNVQYGVFIQDQETGRLGGYAWGGINLGWIDFSGVYFDNNNEMDDLSLTADPDTVTEDGNWMTTLTLNTLNTEYSSCVASTYSLLTDADENSPWNGDVGTPEIGSPVVMHSVLVQPNLHNGPGSMRFDATCQKADGGREVYASVWVHRNQVVSPPVADYPVIHLSTSTTCYNESNPNATLVWSATDNESIEFTECGVLSSDPNVSNWHSGDSVSVPVGDELKTKVVSISNPSNWDVGQKYAIKCNVLSGSGELLSSSRSNVAIFGICGEPPLVDLKVKDSSSGDDAWQDEGLTYTISSGQTADVDLKWNNNNYDQNQVESCILQSIDAHGTVNEDISSQPNGTTSKSLSVSSLFINTCINDVGTASDQVNVCVNENIDANEECNFCELHPEICLGLPTIIES